MFSRLMGNRENKEKKGGEMDQKHTGNIGPKAQDPLNTPTPTPPKDDPFKLHDVIVVYDGLEYTFYAKASPPRRCSNIALIYNPDDTKKIVQCPNMEPSNSEILSNAARGYTMHPAFNDAPGKYRLSQATIDLPPYLCLSCQRCIQKAHLGAQPNLKEEAKNVLDQARRFNWN